MKAITKVVLDNKADLGIIIDTDVDRSDVVDSTGREFNQNRLIVVMETIVLDGVMLLLLFVSGSFLTLHFSVYILKLMKNYK
ncbi:hypothetical protein P8452_10559 [Trifolium repens]|nr:phosphoglucosamine mutase family protein [Trifolium repens]WJX21086.1 hypothetical protein P8452_10559 [Trifolium repens]